MYDDFSRDDYGKGAKGEHWGKGEKGGWAEKGGWHSKGDWEGWYGKGGRDEYYDDWGKGEYHGRWEKSSEWWEKGKGKGRGWKGQDGAEPKPEPRAYPDKVCCFPPVRLRRTWRQGTDWGHRCPAAAWLSTEACSFGQDTRLSL